MLKKVRFLFVFVAIVGLLFGLQSSLLAEEVSVRDIINQILIDEGVDPDVHWAFQEAVSQPAEPLAIELDRPLQIGWTSPSFDISDAWRRYYWAMRLRLEEAGIEHEVNYQSSSRHDAHDEQLAHIETFIVQDVDLIVLGPTELYAQRVAISQIHEAGIPLIIMNHSRRLPDDEETLMYTAFDHEVGGIVQGEWVAEVLDGSGKLALLRIVPGDMDDHRWGGTWSVLQDYDFEIVDEAYTKADRHLSYSTAEAMLTAHPDLDMIYATCSANALGAAAAVEEMGRKGEVLVVGFGGSPEEVEEMMAGRMAGSVFRFIDDSGAAAGHAIQLYLEGRQDEIPGVHTGDYTMVDYTITPEEMDEINLYAERYTYEASMGPYR